MDSLGVEMVIFFENKFIYVVKCGILVWIVFVCFKYIG